MCRSWRELSNEYLHAKFGLLSCLLASIQPRTSLAKFARSPRTDRSPIIIIIIIIIIFTDRSGLNLLSARQEHLLLVIDILEECEVVGS